AQACDLADRLLDGARRRRCLYAHLQHERTGQAAELEGGAGAVGEALVLAQIEIDAAHELPAENRVRHHQRVIVGRVARDRDVAGMSRSCVRRCRRSWRTREKSLSRSAGRTTMSERSASARSAKRLSTVALIDSASDPMSVSNCAPMRASSS